MSFDPFEQIPTIYVAPASVIIPEDRQREKAEPDEGLLTSIRSVGIIHPPTVRIGTDGTYILMSGERRLRSAILIGMAEIPVRLYESLPKHLAFLLELQENLQRKNLTWQEEAKSILTYHNLRKGNFPGWTQMATAQDLGRSTSNISDILVVASQLDDSSVAAAATITGALNYIQSKSQRTIAAAQAAGMQLPAAIAGAINFGANATAEQKTAAVLDALTKPAAEPSNKTEQMLQLAAKAKSHLAADAAAEVPRPTDDTILNVDFLSWLSTYTGPRFDVLHCDFPYGKDYRGAQTSRQALNDRANPTYADSKDIYFALLEGMLAEQHRIVGDIAHCIFWFDMQFYTETIQLFEAAGWKLVQPFPLIWGKFNSGVASDPLRRPRHCYETALFFSRGDRRIVKLVQDYKEHSLDELKLHISQKPAEMLKHFLSLVVDEHTRLLDPTCGSGTSLLAARKLGARDVLGLELDPSNAEIARFTLLDSPKA